jgi:hypothetical protein
VVGLTAGHQPRRFSNHLPRASFTYFYGLTDICISVKQANPWHEANLYKVLLGYSVFLSLLVVGEKGIELKI